MNKQRQKEKIVKSIKNSTASEKLSSEDICAIADALIIAGFAEMKSFAEYVGGTIAGHSNYHGDTILSALYCAAEGKEIDYLKPLNITEYGYKEAIKAKQELQDEIARLTAENKRLRAEKTCRNISDKNPVDEFKCSKCGFMAEDFHRLVIDEDDGEHINYEYIIKYCPNCGAKVEDEQ